MTRRAKKSETADVQGPAAAQPPTQVAGEAAARRDPVAKKEEPGPGELVPGAAQTDAPALPHPAHRRGRGGEGAAGNPKGQGVGRRPPKRAGPAPRGGGFLRRGGDTPRRPVRA